MMPALSSSTFIVSLRLSASEWRSPALADFHLAGIMDSGVPREWHAPATTDLYTPRVASCLSGLLHSRHRVSSDIRTPVRKRAEMLKREALRRNRDHRDTPC
jgi:hypothetical protein